MSRRDEFLRRLGRDPTQPLAFDQPPGTAQTSFTGVSNIPWQWQYAREGPYITQLNPQQESQFQQWVRDFRDPNDPSYRIPFDPSPTADYDMRGFWQAMRTGDPRAQMSTNPNDQQPHFSDPWKTPYHHSFSGESIYALPHAPHWNQFDQLVDPRGNVVFDERQFIHDQEMRNAEENVNRNGRGQSG